MKIIVFGTGDYYQRYRNFIIDNVIGFLDNNESKQGTFIDGIQVYAPKEGIKQPYDRIYILSAYFREMKEQLLSFGVDENRILSPSEVENILRSDKVSRPVKLITKDSDTLVTCLGDKRILMLTPDLKLNGATVALMGAVSVCRKRGYEVVVGAIQSGEAEKKIIGLGAQVVIDENLIICTLADIKWISSFNTILCNTVLFYRLLTEKREDLQILWWLHDPPYIYGNLDKGLCQRIDFKNIWVLGAGRITVETFKQTFPKSDPKIMIYGLTDTAIQKHMAHDGYRFMTAGDIQEWKGQDIFCKAAEKILNDKEIQLESAELDFQIVGNNKSKMAANLISKYKGNPAISFSGLFTREKMDVAYSLSDVYVCSSRQETMSITTVEAMMHEIPCIVSDAAGIADFIKDGIDGIIFKSGDVDDLYDKMLWCINNKDIAEKIGKKGRRLYESTFSKAVFDNNLMRILRKMENDKRDYAPLQG